MSWPKLLVLVRHAESEGNVRTVEERAQYEVSTHAYNLTEKGREQAKITGEYLRGKYGAFDVYYTSYYARAKETMKIMYPDAKVCEDSRLAEGHRGIWHSMTYEQVLAQFPKEPERKELDGLYHYRPFGGENWPDIEGRIHSFRQTLRSDHEDETVVMVVHGHWLILFQKLIQHFSIEEAERRYKTNVFKNASVTVYEPKLIDGKSKLALVEENLVPWDGKL